ncbi:hypothetical protein AYO21_09815 [Fonsecaea monophora]|uniref:Uncharacterized protein n=1 Tax=Fonsecaea monophora TaxID=254056 RepID=A0A177EYA8_9EURO|nr:hypothetical protein AYO21_09815 [Fonsecaea monophora]OAG36022.1 hypothetical protein AYO21_09815 [Fonsecaea monophora]
MLTISEAPYSRTLLLDPCNSSSSPAPLTVCTAVTVTVRVLTAIVSAAVTAPTAPIVDRPATPVAAGGRAEDPGDNRPLRRPLPNDAPPAPSPSKRAKTAKAKGSCCCRYLRRLRAAGDAAGREIECVFMTETGRRSTNYSYYSKGKRGSRSGCVPREADAIDAELRLVETDVARKSAGGLTIGGRMRSARDSSAGTAGAGGGQLKLLLAYLIDAVRAAVDSYREVNNLEARVWPDEDSGSDAE